MRCLRLLAQASSWRLFAGLSALWLLVVVYTTNPVLPHGYQRGPPLEEQLEQALLTLTTLHSQNVQLAAELKGMQLITNNAKDKETEILELQRKLSNITNEMQILLRKPTPSARMEMSGMGNIPSLEHEVVRRKVENDAKEFWYYIRAALLKLKGLTAGGHDTKWLINSTLQNAAAYQRTITNDLWSLGHGLAGLQDWQKNESRDLANIVQTRLRELQNPADCSSARTLLCGLGKACGFGCQLHHVTYCLLVAYANNRTMVLQSKGWSYSAGGWETVFQPVSDTCSANSKAGMGGDQVRLPLIDSLSPRPDYLPLAIPDDIADRLSRFHGDPSVWWIGQLVSYLMRPQKPLEEDIEGTKRSLGFNNPVVGIHVRRTDKVGNEAAFHRIEEYMTYVEEWFDTYEQKHPGVRRQVYLASDDPNVLREAKAKYPTYVFISDSGISKTASLATRYSNSSLRGVIIDIHLLSLCDFIVCTFSSQVCRVAYELMQTKHADASQFFKSLDDIYYFGGQNAHLMETVEAHKPQARGEIELQVGDLIHVAGNHWDGLSMGTNLRTRNHGLYPSYKTRNTLTRVKLPVDPEHKMH